jgi:hypothetical protein
MTVYNLIDCLGQADEILIEWTGAGFLDPAKSYIFDFAPDTCYVAQLRFSNDTLPQYNESNIIEEYDDCATCNAICYRLIDCDGGDDVLTSDDLAGYVGETIKWTDGETEYCSQVQSFVCRTESFSSTDVTVIDCFDNCTECTAVPATEPEPAFEGTKRTVKPKYEVPLCRPEDYEKAKCKFSELLFHEVASKRYGIEFCCDDDLSKWEIQQELMELQVIQSRYNQEDFNTDTDSGLEDCSEPGIGNMRVDDDSCVIFRVVPIDEPLTP